MDNRIDQLEGIKQDLEVILTLYVNIENLTLNEALELLKELNTFAEGIKHIYINAASSRRLTEDNRIDQLEGIKQNLEVISALTVNIENLTTSELLELHEKIKTFGERIKHIYINVASSGRLTETV